MKNTPQPKEIRSMDEYEKRFFPKSYEARLSKEEDAPSIGARLAQESLKKVLSKLRSKQG